MFLSDQTKVGDVIGEFNATDPEGGNLIFYLLEQSNNIEDNYFSLSSKGILKLENEIPYDVNQSFILEVGVMDDANLTFKESFVLTYTLEETEPSNLPFYFTSTELKVEENQPIGAKVGTFYATSGISPGEEVEFSLNSEQQLFSIDINGTLRTRLSFDFEEMDNTTIFIEVVGMTSQKQMTIREFTVEIIDQNDSHEKLDSFDFNATQLLVSEDEEIGSVVGSFFTSDEYAFLDVKYQLNDPNSLFAIENEKLVTRVELDYDKVSYYNLMIEVIATHHSEELKTRVFEVTLEDVNFSPFDISTTSDLQVIGDDPESHLIGPFLVIDGDESDEHIFQLVEGNKSNDNQFFTVDQKGNLHFVNNDLLATHENLTICLRATDPHGLFVDRVFTIKYEKSPGDAAIFLDDAFDAEFGWKRAGWFGFFFSEFYPWVHHENLGWIFIEQKDSQNTWLFRDGLGWCWTNPEFFPYLFVFDRKEWIYLERNHFPAVLYDYKYEEWFSPDRTYEIVTQVNRSVGGKIGGGGNYKRWNKVKIIAEAEAGFKFTGWTGDIEGADGVLEVEITRDLYLEANFEPDLSLNLSTNKSLQIINKYVESLDNLTEEEKKQAVTDLFLYGKTNFQ